MKTNLAYKPSLPEGGIALIGKSTEPVPEGPDVEGEDDDKNYPCVHLEPRDEFKGFKYGDVVTVKAKIIEVAEGGEGTGLTLAIQEIDDAGRKVKTDPTGQAKMQDIEDAIDIGLDDAVKKKDEDDE